MYVNIELKQYNKNIIFLLTVVSIKSGIFMIFKLWFILHVFPILSKTCIATKKFYNNS